MIQPSIRNLASVLICVAIATVPMQAAHADGKPAAHAGKTRTYYVAADEIDWNYAPSGRDEAMDMPFDAIAREFTESGPHQIGSVYKKAVYHEYTDGTFTTLKPRAPEDQYLGIMGPILYAEVGDTMKVVFRNHASHPFGMHPHGVQYAKDSEGADYNDGTSGADKEDACVAPGATHTYTWNATDAAAPGPQDPTSLFWLYHSHCDELRDVASGLFGGMVITGRGKALPNGHPKGVDHEFVAMFIAVNENESWYLDENIAKHTTDPKGVKRDELNPINAAGYVGTVAGQGFASTNVKWSINGYIYGNLPMMVMKKGDHVRWYVTTLGDFNNAHTPHWHGNTVLVAGQRTDVISVISAQMVTADMVPENPGMWLFHCHISDHMLAGMMARYEVKER